VNNNEPGARAPGFLCFNGLLKNALKAENAPLKGGGYPARNQRIENKERL
jgi:hypothetical protein